MESTTVTELIKGVEGKTNTALKPHLRAIDPHLLYDIGMVFRHGAKKHGLENFRTQTPEAAGEVWDALLRHAVDFASGKPIDAESGLHALAHLGANLSMLYRLIHEYGSQAVLNYINPRLVGPKI